MKLKAFGSLLQLQVINESLRLGSLSPAMFRKAMSDVEVKGKSDSLFCIIKNYKKFVTNNSIKKLFIGCRVYNSSRMDCIGCSISCSL